ncbi:MAG: AsmA family protein, partial [Planctomycetota bacterium]
MKIRRRTAVIVAVAVLLGSAATVISAYLDEETIRGTIVRQLQAQLSEGHTLQLDRVEYDWDEERLTATGLRLRRRDEPMPLAEVARIEIQASLWNLLMRSPARSITLVEPAILVERRADGSLPLNDAFRKTDRDAQAPQPPAIVVKQGRITFRDRTLFADREDVVIDIESLTLEPEGDSGVLAAELVERGSVVHDGAGALGRISVSGRLPL